MSGVINEVGMCAFVSGYMMWFKLSCVKKIRNNSVVPTDFVVLTNTPTTDQSSTSLFQLNHKIHFSFTSH